MVHALRDAWRTLRPHGTLIDLRPLPAVFGIDIVSASGAHAVGQCDATATAEDDSAADRAAAHAADEGWLVARGGAEFEIAIYWDTAAEMAEYLHGRRPKPVTPSFEDIDAALRNARSRTSDPVRLRCTRRMILGSYTKGSVRRSTALTQ